MEAAGALVVVPGFVALGADGVPTTLGRGGSDATAVWLAATLGACAVELHKPVAGVRRADPEWVAQAARVPALSWDEAHELARRGARVLQARAASLAREHGIGIELRALAAPEAPGTSVGELEPAPRVVALVHDVLPGGQRCELFLVGARASERADLVERARAALASAGLSARPLASRGPHAVGYELPLREAREGLTALHTELFDDPPA